MFTSFNGTLVSRSLSRKTLLGFSVIALFFALASDNTSAAPYAPAEIEEVVVWGENQDRQGVGYVNPTSLLKQEDLIAINIATAEDVVKYEPSLVIRRRFIGDSNGVMGIRGSNMFQTSRSMVFADGVPLHYLLQSRWNGAPRWTMVSASEIAQVETLYGPFNAEHSGNSIGGVVLIETAIPQKREFHFDTSFFSQSFDDYGFDDTVRGHKSFFSYGDRFGNASVYLSYNHLDNDSQPQTFFTGGLASDSSDKVVSGAIPGVDSRDRARLYFGDTGVVNTETDNLKLKLGYDSDVWSALVNIAFEDRASVADSPNSYVRDTGDEAVWSGNVTQDGKPFSIPASRLNIDERDRESLSLGLRLKAKLKNRLSLEGNFSTFNVLSDEARSSARNPNDGEYRGDGEVTEYDETGWLTAELKLDLEDFITSGASLLTGIRYEAYELNFDLYESGDWSAGSKDFLTGSSGGKTDIIAAFIQTNWIVNERWDMSLGGRYESFRSDEGYFSDDDLNTPNLDLIRTASTNKDEFSPKFSVGFQPSDLWRMRYSFGRAFRFPIVEELFSQYRAFNAISISNPDLEPEDATAHNLMIDREIHAGYLRINFFKENVKDVIESQSTVLPGGVSIRTFVPIDEVQTQGVEFVINQNDIFVENLDVRFNATYTDSEILQNNANPSIQGNRYPRMPEWRGNLLATYHANDRWDVSANLQYASDSFGRSDNTDLADGVYGAQDEFTRIGLKSRWKVTEALSFGIGVDNITNEIAYVAHPWPGRTWYGSLSYDIR